MHLGSFEHLLHFIIFDVYKIAAFGHHATSFDRFQVFRGRLAPCRCTWPRWLDGSFGLSFHEIFVALGSSPAREKWPSTAGQRNRSWERWMRYIRCISAFHWTYSNHLQLINRSKSTRIQPRWSKVLEIFGTKVSTKTLCFGCAYFCGLAPSYSSLRGYPPVSPAACQAASGKCGVTASSLTAQQNILWGKSTDGWMPDAYA